MMQSILKNVQRWTFATAGSYHHDFCNLSETYELFCIIIIIICLIMVKNTEN